MSESHESPNVSSVNPATKRTHARERYQQIRAPVLIAALLMILAVLAMFALFTAARTAQFSIVADTLLCVFTLVPCLVGVVIILLINTGLVVGLGYLNEGLPRPFKRLQDGTARLEASVTSLVRKPAGLVIKLNGQIERWAYMSRLGRTSDSTDVQHQEEKA
ncbi:MAG: hypothetical protein JXB47_03280 [Anaerolineae bacterium]|nr:hypothetical protein [Anaerolineae bacterium]